MALTRTEMLALTGTNLPDNTSQEITPQKVREVFNQLTTSALFGAKLTLVMSAVSTANQAPTALDTPVQVTFGPAVNSASDDVMINAAGLVTVNKTGNYLVVLRFTKGRTGASGTSIFLTRLMYNGVQAGRMSVAKIETSEQLFATETTFAFDGSAGDTFYLQMARDSAGTNYGGLFALTPTTLAWGPSASAELSIYKFEDSEA